MSWQIGAEDLDSILQDALVSGDLYLGEEYLGAAPRAMATRGRAPSPALRQAVAQAVANRQVARGAILRETRPDESRELPLFFRATVTTLTQALITQRPQKSAFKPRRVIVSPSIASLFRLNQVVIGVTPQQIATGGARADLFTPDSLITFDMDTATTSMDVIFDVNNISGADAEFNGMLSGPVVQS